MSSPNSAEQERQNQGQNQQEPSKLDAERSSPPARLSQRLSQVTPPKIGGTSDSGAAPPRSR